MIDEKKRLELRKIAAWLPASDESIVDFSLGTTEEQRAAADRLEARRLEARAAWYALPLRVRVWRQLVARRRIAP